MKTTRLVCGVLLVVMIALLAISLPLIAADNEDGDVQVTLQDLPAPVKATLLNVTGAGTIKDLEKERSGIYSADVYKDGVKYDVEIAADGVLLKNEVDKEDDEKDKDEDEVTVTIDQVPAAVAATIKQQAGTGTIGEIEQETEKSQTIYSAEITKDGKKFEIEVAADGKLIKVEADNEEDDEDDD